MKIEIQRRLYVWEETGHYRIIMTSGKKDVYLSVWNPHPDTGWKETRSAPPSWEVGMEAVATFVREISRPLVLKEKRHAYKIDGEVEQWLSQAPHEATDTSWCLMLNNVDIRRSSPTWEDAIEASLRAVPHLRTLVSAIGS